MCSYVSSCLIFTSFIFYYYYYYYYYYCGYAWLCRTLGFSLWTLSRLQRSRWIWLMRIAGLITGPFWMGLWCLMLLTRFLLIMHLIRGIASWSTLMFMKVWPHLSHAMTWLRIHGTLLFLGGFMVMTRLGPLTRHQARCWGWSGPGIPSKLDASRWIWNFLLCWYLLIVTNCLGGILC